MIKKFNLSTKHFHVIHTDMNIGDKEVFIAWDESVYQYSLIVREYIGYNKYNIISKEKRDINFKLIE